MSHPLSPDELKSLYGESYVKAFVSKQSRKRLANLITFMPLRSSYCVADYGCGSGMLVPWIAPHVAAYSGVDFSPEFIKTAQQQFPATHFPNASFYCARIQDFCNENLEKFDVAFAMDFSEHVYDDDWKDILVHIRKSLKPTGILYLHTPNADFLIEKMKQYHIILKQFPEHIAIRTPEENFALLNSSGFTTINTRLLPHYLLLLKPLHVFSHIPIIGKYFKARIFIEAKQP